MATTILLFLSQACTVAIPGRNVDEFDDQQDSNILDFHGSGGLNTLNISLPAESYVLSATMNLSPLHIAEDLLSHARSPSLQLNNTVLWKFDDSDFGAFGMQTGFSTGPQARLEFDPDGGANAIMVRLPQNISAIDAYMNINCSGKTRYSEIVNFSVMGGDYTAMVSWAGDLNMDGFDDLLYGNYGCATIIFGGPRADEHPHIIFSNYTVDTRLIYWDAHGAGDVNGDGFLDIICGVGSEEFPGGARYADRAFIFFGNSTWDNTTDLVLRGDVGSVFGGRVSGAGDVNNDGYDDILVGACLDDSYGRNAGRAYLYFGGPNMDNIPDIVLSGSGTDNSQFGIAVSGAGDLNNDGYDDLIVAEGSAVFVFFGGPHMDGNPDLMLNGSIDGGGYGPQISGAGDLNGDGFDDIIVGAPGDQSKAMNAGKAVIYLGGQVMDNDSDMEIFGNSRDERFGYSVSGAGDLNKDGFSDVIVGSIENWSGLVTILFGGKKMDAIPDIIFDESTSGTSIGMSVAGHGDFNGDGFDDVAALAPLIYSGYGFGKICIFGGAPSDAIYKPKIRIGSHELFNGTGHVNGTETISDFSSILNQYLVSAPINGSDGYGNGYVDVRFDVNAMSGGNITFTDLRIRYDYNATVPDFSKALNEYISKNRDSADVSGNITIPLELWSDSSGRIKASALDITLDEAPGLIRPIPDTFMDEDTMNPTLIDLHDYFNDEYDSLINLSFSVASADNGGYVNVSIASNRYVSADALTGDANDNWTGEARMKVAASDSHNSTRLSNEFRIIIRNVNDPPAITSTPLVNITSGTLYSYAVTAIDGDNDILVFEIIDPPTGMIINSTTGQMSWVPASGGNYPVSISVSDGQANVHQNYTILVIQANRPPRFVSTPVTAATVGREYRYQARALDVDGDNPTYFVHSPPEGLTVNASTGDIVWIPKTGQTGNVSVTVVAADGRGGEARQEFVIAVKDAEPTGPLCRLLHPSPGSRVSGTVKVSGNATRGTFALVRVQIQIDGGQWETASGTENWSYSLDTTRLKNGRHTLSARASDDKLGSDPVSVDFIVTNPEPGLTVGSPAWLGTLIIIIVIVAASVFMLSRRRSARK